MTTPFDTVVVPVKDLARARDLYRVLTGVEPFMDQPYYVGFQLDGQQLGLDPHGFDRGLTGPVAHRPVDDIAAVLADLRALGATVRQPATDVGGGKLVAMVADTDGNVFGLTQEP